MEVSKETTDRSEKLKEYEDNGKGSENSSDIQISNDSPSIESKTKVKKLSPTEEKQRAKVEKSQLYIQVAQKQWPIVYAAEYNISFLGLEKLHPFDAGKWGRIFDFLKESKMVREETIVKPLEATEDDLLVVHSRNYINSLKLTDIVEGINEWSMNVAGITEVPPVALLPNFVVQKRVLRPFRHQTGGSILAGKLAMDRGWAINIGGGFHHCSAERGGGFCAYADITLSIKFLFEKVEGVSKVMIVDLDAHQGNGHERDFMDDDRVYIMDVYNRGIYPHDGYAKRAIKRKVELNHFTDDVDYLDAVKNNLRASLEEFTPDIIVYNAGTDILEGEPLGNLSVTAQGIILRDEMVFAKARELNIPIFMLTSGGYTRGTARIIADSILNLRQQKLISCEEADSFMHTETDLSDVGMSHSQSEGSLLSRCKNACVSFITRSSTQEFDQVGRENGQSDKG
ncbi:histone deacetylase 11-like isoform X2 [Haliotis rubra]|uniref:histone deacetylase 11-like isoform X2 n=1 Tax=Haliotis rubra TaxID=36100 RepID=UPI001EE53ADA|nr:histone deacetylase 11-like isoform X2 [Haliotis rubra]